MNKYILILIVILFSIFVNNTTSAVVVKISKKYPDNFIKMMNNILLFEGGYFAEEVTNFGVMQPIYDDYRKKKKLPQQDVNDITITEVYDIYYNMYYLKGKCNLLTPATSFVHFDACINFGIGGATKLLKKTIGLDYNTPYWNDSILIFITDSVDIDLAYNYINNRMIKRYEIVKDHPKKKKFLKGWISRDDQVSSLITKYY